MCATFRWRRREQGPQGGCARSCVATVVGVARPPGPASPRLWLRHRHVGFRSPAVMWLAFIPMACIAAAFFYLNRADPDCGTNFAWVTRDGAAHRVDGRLEQHDRRPHHHAEPRADRGEVHVPPVRLYSRRTTCLVDAQASGHFHHGHDVDLRRRHRAQRRHADGLPRHRARDPRRVQRSGLVQGLRRHIPGSVHPTLSWLKPSGFGGIGAFTQGILLAVFIYWGWDTAASVNEECEDANRRPASRSALDVHPRRDLRGRRVRGAGGEGRRLPLEQLRRRALGDGQDRLRRLGLRVGRAQAADHRGAELGGGELPDHDPPAARTALSMAMHRAFPGRNSARSIPKHLTPAFSDVVVRHHLVAVAHVPRVVSRVYGGDVLTWSVDGVGLMIAYYYGQTGFACVIYYRRYLFKSFKNFFFVGLLPLIGGLSLGALFLQSIWDMTSPDYTGDGYSVGRSEPRGSGSVSASSSGHPGHVLVEFEGPHVLQASAIRSDRRPPPESGEPCRRSSRRPGWSTDMAGEIVLGYDGQGASAAALRTARGALAFERRSSRVRLRHRDGWRGCRPPKTVEGSGRGLTTGEAVPTVECDRRRRPSTCRPNRSRTRPATVLAAADQYDVGDRRRGNRAGTDPGRCSARSPIRSCTGSTRPVLVVPSADRVDDNDVFVQRIR